MREELKKELAEQQFSSFEDWCNTASRKLAIRDRSVSGMPSYKTPPEQDRAICYDMKGKRCWIGGDFRTAEYPVRYMWPDQAIELALEVLKQ